MKHWDERPIEIRNLFNPAFCGLTLIRSLIAYEEEDKRGMPFSLALLILPLALHKQSREILARSNRSYFLKIVASHPELLVGLPKRTAALLPFTFEAFGFLMNIGTFTVQGNGRLIPLATGVKKTISGTNESITCQKVARFLGKEFARIGDRGTVYATLGVKP